MVADGGAVMEPSCSSDSRVGGQYCSLSDTLINRPDSAAIELHFLERAACIVVASRRGRAGRLCGGLIETGVWGPAVARLSASAHADCQFRFPMLAERCIQTPFRINNLTSWSMGAWNSMRDDMC
jgi:hypothetical protein